jgi:phospholipid/cholesterol/gamma-HCH transport system substrate-binding protein
MITRRTKVQLLVFAIITLLGVSYVGARYARLDRVFIDDTYTVVAHFADSGGAFAGAEVSYRGVRVGEVSEMVLTDDGVDIHLDIDKEQDRIPADSLALVGNRSAVGEQYVELQPQVDDGPFLEDRSQIAMDRTRTPIMTDTLLTHLSETVRSVDEKDLQTVTTEFGAAFGGAGQDLQTIIDSGTSFIDAADANFEITTKLIRDGNVVLNGQIASESALRSFARDLSTFSTSLAGSDKDLRSVIDNGSATATQLRTFIEDNEVQLGELINNLVTTGEVVVKNIKGVEQPLVIYPYVVEGGFTVVSRTPATGNYDAHFGMVLTQDPAVCHAGYESTDTRLPADGENRPMNTAARCTEPASQSNARGGQHAPRAGASYDPRRTPAPPAPASSASPPVAAYDPETGTLVWGETEAARLESRGSVAPRTLGEESWKWLFLKPLLTRQ